MPPPISLAPYISPTTYQRLVSRLRDFGDKDKCWEWTGGRREGYEQIYVGEPTKRKAHRLAYEIFIGPIPEGMVIDHLCRNRACCNPDHLEPVTDRENILRGIQGRAHRTGRCPSGHDLTVHGFVRQNKNQCRECYRLRRGSTRKPYGALVPPQPCAVGCGWLFEAPGPKALHERKCSGKPQWGCAS